MLKPVIAFLALFALVNARPFQQDENSKEKKEPGFAISIPFFSPQSVYHSESVKIADRAGLGKFIEERLNLQGRRGYRITDEYTSSNGVTHVYARQTMFGVEVTV